MINLCIQPLRTVVVKRLTVSLLCRAKCRKTAQLIRILSKLPTIT